MKKMIKIIGTCLLVFALIIPMSVSADDGVKVMLNGEYIEFDVKPQIINGRTMVPLRAIFEELGAEVDWDGDTQTVTAVKDDTVVKATIGSTKMYVDTEVKTMDVAPMIIGGRTLVPARFVAEAFDCYVSWDEVNSIVYITSSEVYAIQE